MFHDYGFDFKGRADIIHELSGHSHLDVLRHVQLTNGPAVSAQMGAYMTSESGFARQSVLGSLGGRL